MLADSGNGGHVLIRIDLPNDDESRVLIGRCLRALAFVFDDAQVTVDRSVGNAARLVKVYGTLAAKGDSTADRPHRFARLLEAPAVAVPVERDVLERLAALAPPAKQQNGGRSPHGDDGFDLEKWVSEHELSILRFGPWQGGQRWLLRECPFNQDHQKGSAALLHFPSGAVAFRCLHNGCTGKDWHALRDLLEPSWRERRSGGRTRPARAGTGPDEPHLTDLGNARRLVAAHGNDFRYCGARGGWLAWDGRHWAVDETAGVMRWAKATIRDLYGQAAAVEEEKERRQLAGHALKSEARRALEAMVALAASEPGIPARAYEFDADPWALNVENGTLDLRSGLLRPHRRDDLITKLAPVVYDAHAMCPIFDAFLRRIFGGTTDLIRFVQRAVGYSLTGSTVERLFFILWGAGKNGKTTLLESMRFVLGDYAMRTPVQMLLAKRGDGGIPNDVARLLGARFVTASEADEGKRLAEAQIKT